MYPGSIQIAIEESIKSYRDSMRVVTITIKNESERVLVVDKCEFALPKGTKLLSASSEHMRDRELERVKLLKDLTLLLNDEVFFSLSVVQERRRRILQTFVEDVLGSSQETVAGVMRKLICNITRPWVTRVLVDKFLERLHATALVISSSSDGERVMSQVAASSSVPDRMLNLVFAEKLRQLKEIENELQSGSLRDTDKVSIAPRGNYQQHAVLEFDQSLFTAKPYNVQFTTHGYHSDNEVAAARAAASPFLLKKI